MGHTHSYILTNIQCAPQGGENEKTSHGHIGFFYEGQYDKLMISSLFLYSSRPWEILARL